MCKSCLSVLLAALLLAFSACACAEGFTHLDMNSTAIAQAPKDECYLSDNEYKDDSISFLELKDDKGEVIYTWGVCQADADAYDLACDEMRRATSLKQVTEIWNRYPMLKNDKGFTELCAEMGRKYKKTA